MKPEHYYEVRSFRMAFQQVRYRCTMIKHKIFHKLQTYYRYCAMHHGLQKRHEICEIVDFEDFKGIEVSNNHP